MELDTSGSKLLFGSWEPPLCERSKRQWHCRATAKHEKLLFFLNYYLQCHPPRGAERGADISAGLPRLRYSKHHNKNLLLQTDAG